MKVFLTPLFLNYLRTIARLQLKKHRPIIIGITGSAGKTSAMTACAVVLKPKYKVKISYKANSESGIPLDILGLHPTNYSIIDWLRLALLAPIKLITNQDQPEIYLVEMGIDSPLPPKNMTYLLSIIQPDVGIFLNAALSHTQNFDSLVKNKNLSASEREKHLTKLIALEKGKIITTLPKSATGIINTDDEQSAEIIQKSQATILTFGSMGHPIVKVTGVEYGRDKTRFLIKYQAKTYQLNLKNMILPVHFGHSFAAAICCGFTQGVSINQAIRHIEQDFSLEPGRSSIIEGVNHSQMIDSSYNASPQTMIDMLELMSKVPGKRKLALLGDMRELGDSAMSAHFRVAKKAAQVCDQVHLVGPLMAEHALPILQKAKIKVTCHDSARQAADVLKDQLLPDDVLLIKGSQNTLLLEIAVQQLMAHPEQAEQLLCRRGPYWDKQRRMLI